MPPNLRLQNLDFGSNICLLSSRRGLKRRVPPIGCILAEFQLKWSHGDLFRDQNRADQLLPGADQSILVVLTSDYLVVTIDCSVLMNHYSVVTMDNLVVTIDNLVVTIDYLGVTSNYLVLLHDYLGM